MGEATGMSLAGDGGFAPEKHERRLRRYVASWAFIALAVAGGVAAGYQPSLPPTAWLLATLWVVTVLADVAVVYVNYEGARQAISPSEVAAVLLMVLLDPPWAIAVAATAIPVGVAVSTRAAVPKMVFNTAWQVTGIAVGSAVFQALAGPDFAAAPADVLAATLAATAFVATNTIAASGLLAIVSGQGWRAVVGRTVVSEAPLALGMGMTGVLAAVLAVTVPAALPLLAVPTLMDHLRARARRAEVELEVAKTQAEAANLAKSVFLSHISHELRTPLNAILGFGQVLEFSELTTEDEEAVQHIVNAGRHLLALIDDVLDLSRIEAGNMEIVREAVHIGELIGDALALIQPLADARYIRLTTDAAERDFYVQTDRRRCHQVLLNLLSNAVKYNHDAGDVTVTCTRENADTVRVSVRDTGPGIDPARQRQLFEPFERLGAESTDVQGTGLGLALTKQLVEAMGGAIGVETTVGKGSTFWIDLPIARLAATPSKPPTVATR